MKKIKFDYDKNISYETQVNKVRAVIINDKGKCLLVRYAGLYMLPGGRVDEGETELEALKREILEESGIEINVDNLEPYLEIEEYNKNYYTRKQNREINRITNTKFYLVYTDQDVNNDKKRLTESEKIKGHSVEFQNLSIIKYLVETSKTDNNKKSRFDREILTALKEFQIFKEEQKMLTYEKER